MPQLNPPRQTSSAFLNSGIGAWLKRKKLIRTRFKHDRYIDSGFHEIEEPENCAMIF